MLYACCILVCALLLMLPACSEEPDPFMPPTEALVAIRDAVAAGEGSRLQDLAFQLEFSIVTENQYPDDVFSDVLAILSTPAAHRLDGAWHLFFQLQQCWDLLSVSQRDALLAQIRSNYEQYTDFMACFVISELLGEHYANRDALEVVRLLAHGSSTMPRSLVPHALEELHRHATDQQVADEALTLLQSLVSDPHPDVSGEAQISLDRLVHDPRPSTP